MATTLIPATANAADGKGFYGSLSLGGASARDVSNVIYAPGGEIFSEEEEDSVELASFATSVPAGSDTIEGKFDIKPAFQIAGSLGYDFGMIRTDVEVSYARSKISSLKVTRLTNAAGDTTTDLQEGIDDVCFYLEFATCASSGNTLQFEGSKVRQLNAMANVWFDLPVAKKVDVYAGGGLGVAGLEVDGEAKSKFAWQVDAGLAYHLTDHFALTGDVRYRESGKIAYDDAGYGLLLDKFKVVSYGVGVRFTF